HLLEIDERDVELLRERLPQRLVGDVVELEQDLAERQLEGVLLGERVLELRFADCLAREEDLAQPAAPGGGRLHGAPDCFGYACRHVGEGHARGESLSRRRREPSRRSPGAEPEAGPRRPRAAASTWCTPRLVR